MSRYSVRSNDDLSPTLAAMFPELKGTLKITRTKSMYVTNHGFAPYLKSLLKASIDRSDESLNEATQTSDMDLYVRFWDVSENKVSVRY